MRIRTIKPEFWQSESLSRVSRAARLLFVGLFSACDDSGRTRAASRFLASLLFPYDDDAPTCIEGWLEELEREGCIKRYVVEGNTYLEIPKWRDHQKIDKPSPSKIPPFAESSRSLGEGSRTVVVGSGIRDQGAGNGSGSRDQGAGNAPAPAAAVAPQGSKPAEEQEKSDSKAKSPLQLRAEKLHNKRPTTPWDKAEVSAWKAAKPVVEATTEEEWALLERFYAAPQTETFARTNLATTLNNWSGELQRARSWAEKPAKDARNGTNPYQRTAPTKEDHLRDGWEFAQPV